MSQNALKPSVEDPRQVFYSKNGVDEPALADIVEKLVEAHGGKPFRAARALGNDNWRAQIHRLLDEDDDFHPSREFRLAVWKWDGRVPVTIIVAPNVKSLIGSRDDTEVLLDERTWKFGTEDVDLVIQLEPANLVDDLNALMGTCRFCDEPILTIYNRKYCRRHDSRSAWYRSRAGKQWRRRKGVASE